MKLDSIDENMLSLSMRLGFLKDFCFYLSGGTGLALQIGHRKSYDMDFFTSKDFIPDELCTIIKLNNLTIEGVMESHKTLYCVLEGVRTSFILFNEPLLFPLKKWNTLYFVDWRDIIVEKLRIIADRGQKKDFYDFYFGVQKMGINKIVELIYKKYGKRLNYFHLLKGLTYFKDADKNPEPLLIDKSVQWNEIKGFFFNKIKDFEIAFAEITKSL